MTRTEHLLTILSEECNEVGQRASKALRFGLTEVQPEQKLNNAERIMQEFADLIGVYTLLVGDGLLPDINPALVAVKINKIEFFLDYSRKQGTLTP